MLGVQERPVTAQCHSDDESMLDNTLEDADELLFAHVVHLVNAKC